MGVELDGSELEHVMPLKVANEPDTLVMFMLKL